MQVALGDLESEDAGSVEAKDLGPLAIVEVAHRAFDRLGGIRPGALVMREVVRPEEVVDQTVLAGKVKAGGVLLEAREALALEVLAGQQLQLGPDPHMVLEIRLVHRTQHPWRPADAGLDGAEAQVRVPLCDA